MLDSRERGTMPAKFSKTTFEDLAIYLDRALDWLARFEIDVDVARIGDYRRNLRRIVQLQSTLDLKEATANYDKYVNALYSLNEIAQVFRTLGGGGFDSYIRDRLKVAACGPVFYTDERASNSSNRARNMEFELVFTGHCVSGGLTLLPHRVADIQFSIGDYTVVVECKRPQSENKLDRAVSDANKQLRRRFETASRTRTRGIVAIDVTKILNPKFEVIRAKDLNHANVLIEAKVKQLLTRYQDSWQRLFHKKNLAFVLRISAMAEIGEHERNLVHCQQYVVSDLDQRGGNAEILNIFDEALEAGGAAPQIP